jgi:DNA-binding NarL/FixJ family response regulator
MGGRVLIVDDNEDVRRLVRACVESIGLDVCGEAENGLIGVQQAKELSPDVVLLDLSMPKMNGAEAASVLKSAMPDVHIVLFTMYEFGEALAAAVGVDVVLCKADGVSKLISHLQERRGTAIPSIPDRTLRTSNQRPIPPVQPPPTSARDLESFDIFRMFDSGDLVWLGVAETLDEAIARVNSLGCSQPGKYIIRSLKSENTTTIEVGLAVN